MILPLAVLGLLGTTVLSARADDLAPVPAVYSTASDQAVVTPVDWYGPRVYPGWYGSYYYPSPGYSYYPGYYYYGNPGYYSYYYPGPTYQYYTPYGAYYRPYRYYCGGPRWW
jgi:hypothetical protein